MHSLIFFLLCTLPSEESLFVLEYAKYNLLVMHSNAWKASIRFARRQLSCKIDWYNHQSSSSSFLNLVYVHWGPYKPVETFKTLKYKMQRLSKSNFQLFRFRRIGCFFLLQHMSMFANAALSKIFLKSQWFFIFKSFSIMFQGSHLFDKQVSFRQNPFFGT